MIRLLRPARPIATSVGSRTMSCDLPTASCHRAYAYPENYHHRHRRLYNCICHRTRLRESRREENSPRLVSFVPLVRLDCAIDHTATGNAPLCDGRHMTRRGHAERGQGQSCVCYWPLADIASCTAHVAFGGKADMTFCGSQLSPSLLGVKRTWAVAPHMSAFDPKRTWRAHAFPLQAGKVSR